MTEFIDLTHEFHDGMPGFEYENDDGTTTAFTAEISPFLTHEETRPKYDGRASFEISEMRFQTSVGTYVDAPAHRFEGRRDVADLTLPELVHDGIVVNGRGREPNEAVSESVLPKDVDLAGKAVLFNFGWDAYWGRAEYKEYPFVAESLVDRLIADGVGLVGVDALNVDDHHDPDRPAHTKLLDEEIPIVENLCNLDELDGRQFRLFAIPIKARDVVAMPVRAFAEVTS